ncbi:MAG: ATP-binding cassette domain-containing protein [Phycisphaeraceae bacterium]|nr:ATP-binding cassette domain-containing protein [Phycisphaeraceae bacterium]
MSNAEPAPGQAILPVEIRVQKLHKSFNDHEVLRGISFEIRSGEIIAIVGASGGGKTVLLDHLNGLLLASSGTVEVTDHDQPDGRMVNIAEADADTMDAIRLHWSVVFQKNALFSGSVYDNIALWLREHTELSEETIRSRAVEAISAAALDPEDVMNKSREELSGGMAKRVAIARAIAIDPVVVFYDEPTTGLDPIIGGHIHELIWNFHHRKVENPAPDGADRRTSIIVTHDRDLLRRLAPRVVMLDGGTVCFDGPYEQFLEADSKAAREYLQAMPVLHARDGQW